MDEEMHLTSDGKLESILDAVGRTPLVRLNRITKGLSSPVYAKLEFLNPMGSVKDRVAKYMIEQAEKDGRLKNGQLIIENSSGNTALGLAMVAIQKGYRLKVVVRDSISPEKIGSFIGILFNLLLQKIRVLIELLVKFGLVVIRSGSCVGFYPDLIVGNTLLDEFGVGAFI